MLKCSFSFSLSFWSTDLWKNKDESLNFPQAYDPEMVKEEKRKELEAEIRVQVEPHCWGADTTPDQQHPVLGPPPDPAPRTPGAPQSHLKEVCFVFAQVDELMRQELKNIKLAVNREKELPERTAKKKGGKNVSSE